MFQLIFTRLIQTLNYFKQHIIGYTYSFTTQIEHSVLTVCANTHLALYLGTTC